MSLVGLGDVDGTCQVADNCLRWVRLRRRWRMWTLPVCERGVMTGSPSTLQIPLLSF